MGNSLSSKLRLTLENLVSKELQLHVKKNNEHREKFLKIYLLASYISVTKDGHPVLLHGSFLDITKELNLSVTAARNILNSAKPESLVVEASLRVEQNITQSFLHHNVATEPAYAKANAFIIDEIITKICMSATSLYSAAKIEVGT